MPAIYSPNVFVVQDAGFNYDPARAYGELTVLLPMPSRFIESYALVAKLRSMLKDFDDQDFLLLTGDPMMIGIVCCVAASINRGRYKVLRWDRQEQRYYISQIDLNGKEDNDAITGLRRRAGG